MNRNRQKRLPTPKYTSRKRLTTDLFLCFAKLTISPSQRGSSTEECNKVRATIQKQVASNLHDLGVIKHFNSQDIHQTRDFINFPASYTSTRLSVTMDGKMKRLPTGWFQCNMTLLTMPSLLDLATASETTEKEQREQEKSWGSVIAKQLKNWFSPSCTICLRDIAPEHYKVVKAVFVNLNATRDHRLVQWRKTPRDDLPAVIYPDLGQSTGVCVSMQHHLRQGSGK